MFSFVFEALRILVIGSRAADNAFLLTARWSMERGSKRELEKLSMALREIKQKIKSERAGVASSAEPRKSAGQFSWPFCVRAALCVWVVTLNLDAAIEFLDED